ncbi:MAG: DUF2764 domain-containing protein [Treponema sp.]|nr:DUF2764 domain-containing protein [Treponema sp.]
MGAYYYLVAQLPGLVYGQEPPMSSARFRDLARTQLSAGDAALLSLLSLDPQSGAGLPGAGQSGSGPLGGQPGAGSPSYAEAEAPSGSGFIDAWRDWERALRLNLARLRASRLKRDGAAPVDPPADPADAANVAHGALTAAENPLEAEILLDRARWNAIERFQGIPPFSRNAVYAYLLKLLILERRASFKAETGFAEYKSLYASILEHARQGAGEST